jgi:hypothetical protein
MLAKEDTIVYLSDFKSGSKNGCSSCKIIYDGLLLPEINSVRRLDGQGDEKVEVMLFGNNDEGRVHLNPISKAVSAGLR